MQSTGLSLCRVAVQSTGLSFRRVAVQSRWSAVLFSDTTDAKMMVCSVEDPELPKVLSFKPGVGQNVA